MTREEFGKAYQRGYDITVRFLISRGVPSQTADEVSQAAWARGWERIQQLRNTAMVVTWINTIALNINRSHYRKPAFESLEQEPISAGLDLAAIDVRRILSLCRSDERWLLERHHIEGHRIADIARQQGCTETAARIRLLRARRSVGIRLVRLREARQKRAQAA
jgi:DNA-directed RNA polymerase specialized sigma24 family protein